MSDAADTATRDRWPNLRLMVSHGLYYSQTSANREMVAALDALDTLDDITAQRDTYRATLEWVQLHDHSHDAQLARVVAEGLSGEGTA